MQTTKLRRAIAHEAALLLYRNEETEYYQAKQKASRRLCHGWVKPSDLPTNAEIREAVQMFARTHEGPKRLDALRDMRLAALRIMRLVEKFHPKLIGSVLTGHVRQGSDIDIHAFSDSIESVANCFDVELIPYEIERKRVRKGGIETTFTHIHVRDDFDVELTIYQENLRSHVFKSSITGKPIERASLQQLTQLLHTEYPDVDIEQQLRDWADTPDSFQVYYALLLPLENVKQHPRFHPEGDVLYHSLQVYDLACDELPYDEEFLLAALLHDVGKGIEADAHVESALEALSGHISERTQWLIANHMEAHKIFDGTIGARAHRRLRDNESYEELILLSECDRAGRVSGVETSTLEDALDYIRTLGNNDWTRVSTEP
ncbi:MAG: HD domain-containing protein [Pirellula sp.]